MWLKSYSLDEAEAGLVAERVDYSPTRPCDLKFILKFILKFLLWASLFAVFIHLEFGVVYLIVSLIVILYNGTSLRKKTGFSAYSVFNPNMEELKGSIDVKNSYLLAY